METIALPFASTEPRPAPAPGPQVLPLAAITAADRPQVGEKAWNLARLARAGLPVPQGFCITGDAIPAWCQSADSLPLSLVAAVRSAYRQLGACVVAVRSSASDEDRSERSAAGLYASFLNIRGEAALLNAIYECWQARLAPRAAIGRRAGSLPSMAVLVQSQVDAEAAGVLFTADPLGGVTDHMVVNAVWGLGEPLASGRLGGDVFQVNADGELIAQTVSRKERQLTREGEGAVPPGQRLRPSLTRPQIRRLAAMARAVAAHFDGNGDMALDIEFALSQGRPVLLQARPIPKRAIPGGGLPGNGGLSPELAHYVTQECQRLREHVASLRSQGQISGHDVVWSAGNIRELLPTPSAFSFGLFRHIFAGRDGAIVRGRRHLGYRLGPRAGDDLFVLIAGQPYFNLEIDAATFDAGVPVPVPDLITAVSADPAAANYPELGLYPRLVAAAPGGDAAASAFRQRMLVHAARHGRRYRRLLPRLETARQGRPTSFERLETDALMRELATILAKLRSLGLRFVVAARLGFFFADCLRRRLRSLVPGNAEEDYATLLRGLPGSRITEQGHDLERLARGEMGSETFLAAYGHMASNELELCLPRLFEIPEALQRQVAELLASGRRPRREFAAQEHTRRQTEAVLRLQLAGHPAELAEVIADLEAAQTFLPMRETLKYYLAAEYSRLRTLLRTLAIRLDLPADSLFHLTPEEVLSLGPGNGVKASALAAERRAARELARRVSRESPLPLVIFASRLDDMGAVSAAPPAAGQEDSGMAAIPIAPGIAEGTVRCVRLHEDELGSGLPEFAGDEIIVAPSANLGLAPLFRAAAGVVVEAGGILSHSACQAREAGIPALVLAGATTRLHDGDRVRLDSRRGLITVLARAASPREGLR